jgi:hypothetical protein
MWTDTRGNWHIINHAYRNDEYEKCTASVVSCHFFSPDRRQDLDEAALEAKRDEERTPQRWSRPSHVTRYLVAKRGKLAPKTVLNRACCSEGMLFFVAK